MKNLNFLLIFTLSALLIACDNSSSKNSQNYVTTKDKKMKTSETVTIASTPKVNCDYTGDDETALKTGLKDTDEIIFTWKSLKSNSPSKNTSYILRYYIDWDSADSESLQKEFLGETVPVLMGREDSEKTINLRVPLTGKEINEYLKISSHALDAGTKLFLSFDLIKKEGDQKAIVADQWTSLSKLKETDKATPLSLKSSLAESEVSVISKRDCSGL